MPFADKNYPLMNLAFSSLWLFLFQFLIIQSAVITLLMQDILLLFMYGFLLCAAVLGIIYSLVQLPCLLLSRFLLPLSQVARARISLSSAFVITLSTLVIRRSVLNESMVMEAVILVVLVCFAVFLKSFKRKILFYCVGSLFFFTLVVHHHSFSIKPPAHVSRKATSLKTESLLNAILLISCDTLRADHLGCYGNNVVKTPFFDYLARRGFQYSNCYSPQALTTPAHTTMLTGLFPYQHACLSNGFKGKKLRKSVITRLRKKGYTTFAIVSGYPLKRSFFPIASHFDYFGDKFSPGYFPDDLFFSLPLVDLFAQKGLFFDRRYLFERRGFLALQSFESHLSRHIEEPLFFFLHFYEPHGPYEPPTPYDIMYEPPPNPKYKNSMEGVSFPAYQRLRNVTDIRIPMANYKGEVSLTDHYVKQAYQTANKYNRGKLRIIVTADHGESLTENNLFFDHGSNCYEPSIRVPLLTLQSDTPEVPMDKRIISKFCSLTTVSRIILAPPGALQQRASMYHLAFDGEKKIPLTATTNLLSHRAGKAQLKLKFLQQSFIFPPFKYIKDIQSQKEMIYNLEDDPSEMVNLALSKPQLLKRGREAVRFCWSKNLGINELQKSYHISEKDAESLRALGYLD